MSAVNSSEISRLLKLGVLAQRVQFRKVMSTMRRAAVCLLFFLTVSVAATVLVVSAISPTMLLALTDLAVIHLANIFLSVLNGCWGRRFVMSRSLATLSGLKQVYREEGPESK